MNNIIIKICKALACHFIGDYILQTDFLAKTKGENWYHMFIHCFLYCVPFAIVCGFNQYIFILFAIHYIVDPLKATWNKINYIEDQILHLITILIFYVIL